MILGSYNMRVHTPSFGGTVETRVCEKRPKIRVCIPTSIHSERSPMTHTGGISQESRPRRAGISRSPRHMTPLTGRRRP
jgi:hypothetical protein